MHFYKDPQNKVHVLDDKSFENLLPLGCISISAAEAAQLQQPPIPTSVELRELAKADRAVAVSAITITTAAGNTFDGDEASQGRMSRAIIGMEDTEVLPWVLADNTVIEVGKTELREALRLSGAAQSALWVIL